MKLIATPLETKPFVYWQSWDGSNGPLVINEENMPPFEYGVCTWKIEGDELVARTEAEMAVFAAEHATEQLAKNYAAKTAALATAFFVWGGFNFPMHETARLFYGCMQFTPGGNYKVLDTAGVQQTVSPGDNATFIAAYHQKLTELTQP